MKNIKKFLKKHKTEILIGSIIGISSVIITMFLDKKYYKNNFKLIPKGISFISWNPIGGSMPIDEAKKFLDLNYNNNSEFALVKTGKKIIGVLCSNDVITP